MASAGPAGLAGEAADGEPPAPPAPPVTLDTDASVMTRFPTPRASSVKERVVSRVRPSLSAKAFSRPAAPGEEASEASEASHGSQDGEPAAGAGQRRLTKDEQRRYWMPDRLCNVCFDCGRNFTVVRRRHHCRLCGQVFCSKCSSRSVDGRPLGFGGNVRACEFCYKQSAEQRAQGTPAHASMQHLALASDSPVAGDAAAPPSPLASPAFPDDTSAPPPPSGTASPGRGRDSGSSAPASAESPEEPQRQRSRSDAPAPSLQFAGGDAPRKLGASLRTRLRRSLTAGAKEVDEAVGEADGAESTSDGGVVLWEGLPAEAAAEREPNEQADEHDDDQDDPDQTKPRSGTFVEKDNAQSYARSVGFDPQRPMATGVLEPEVRQMLVNDWGTPEVTRRDRAALRAVAQRHLRELVARLVGEAEELGDEWTEVIVGLVTRAVTSVAPNVQGGDAMDVRRYVKVKLIPGGELDECAYLPGVVARKNVAHKRMARECEAPRVLLLNCSIEFDRGGAKLALLDTLMEQEERYMELLVAKIVELRPSVLFVGGTCHRRARELLLQHGVTLAINVKPQLMARLSRATGAPALLSTDALSEAAIGSCERVAFRAFRVPERQTYLFVEGCPADRGCTLLLRGAAREPLRAAKRVASYACAVGYSLTLETAYQLDLCVRSERPVPVRDDELLVTSCWLANGAQCTVPAVQSVAMYSEQDRTLGQFLMTQCFDVSLKCANAKCKRSVLDHTRSFMHARGMVAMRVTRVEHALPVPSSATADTGLPILMWSWCQQCERVVTPCVPMSAATWNLSFGKFLELSVYHDDVRFAGCGHSAHTDRVTLFGFRDLVARYSYVPLTPFEVATNMRLEFRPAVFEARQREQLKRVEQLALEALEAFRAKAHDLTESGALVTGSAVSAGVQVAMHDLAALTAEVSRQLAVFSAVMARAEAQVGGGGGAAAGDDADDDLARILESAPVPAAHGATPAAPAQDAAPKRKRRGVFSRLRRARPAAAAAAAAAAVDGRLGDVDEEGEGEGGGEGEAPAAPAQGAGEGEAGGGAGGDEDEEEQGVSEAAEALDGTTDEDRGLVLYEIARENMLAPAQIQRALVVLFEHWNDRLLLSGKALALAARASGDQDAAAAAAAAAAAGAGADGDLPPSPTDSGPLSSAASGSEAPDDARFSLLESATSTVREREEESHRTLDSIFAPQSPSPPPPPTVAVTVSPPPAGHDEDADGALRESVWGRPTAANEIAERLSEVGLGGGSLGGGSGSGSSRGRPASARSGGRKWGLPFANLAGRDESRSWVVPLGELLEGHPLLDTPEDGTVVLVHEAQPTTLIAYSLASDEYQAQLAQYRAAEGSLDGVEAVMLSQTRTHVKHRFADHAPAGDIKFVVHSYWALQFAALREAFCGNDDYVRSLAMAVAFDVSGGRSGATFNKTADDRFVAKYVTRTELQMFLDCAPAYFEYMSKAFFHELPTMLVKVVGVYQIGVYNKATGRRSMRQIVLMENLLHERDVDWVFDLKGSTRNRWAQVAPGNVLLDDNLMEFTQGLPLPLSEQAKARLHMAVNNCCLFLRIIEIVDYSLLLGVDTRNHTLVVGIIDYLRIYDLMKKMERVGKSINMIAGAAAPTVIQPQNYRRRFQAAMERYFTAVPTRSPTVFSRVGGGGGGAGGSDEGASNGEPDSVAATAGS